MSSSLPVQCSFTTSLSTHYFPACVAHQFRTTNRSSERSLKESSEAKCGPQLPRDLNDPVRVHKYTYPESDAAALWCLPIWTIVRINSPVNLNNAPPTNNHHLLCSSYSHSSSSSESRQRSFPSTLSSWSGATDADQMLLHHLVFFFWASRVATATSQPEFLLYLDHFIPFLLLPAPSLHLSIQANKWLD